MIVHAYYIVFKKKKKFCKSIQYYKCQAPVVASTSEYEVNAAKF